VPRPLAILWLLEFGAWSLGELKNKTDEELAGIVLWLASNDINENGEWLGLLN
jgi:hypothetical protein